MTILKKSLLLPVIVLGVVGCKKLPPTMIHLMPAPSVFEDGAVDPLPEEHPLESVPYAGVLYATDREPSNAEDSYYQNARGLLLRLGVGTLALGDGTYTWDEARRISLQRDRDEDYPMSITSVEEYGFLEESYTPFLDPASVPEDRTIGGKRFSEAVNLKLSTSKKKDVYIYVHGFKTLFENPILVAAELWHYLGYDGVFVAYSWPATPSLLAYASDIETAQVSARNLRLFLAFLARETDAERIHVLGFSAGTRVVLGALNQLAARSGPEDLRLGHVVIMGSDYDRQLFGTHLLDGLLSVPESLTIYESAGDQALGMSNRVFGRNRLGQEVAEGVPQYARDYLNQAEKLVPVSVAEAEGSTTGNGHHYFRESPWVSSDILMLLAHDLSPLERGLVRREGDGLWSFPPDYIERLRQALVGRMGGGKFSLGAGCPKVRTQTVRPG